METTQEPQPTTTYFTFGQKYYHEKHKCGSVVSPSGWWEVRNATMSEAVGIVQILTGGDYAFAYRLDDFNAELYPAGPTRIIDIRDRR